VEKKPPSLAIIIADRMKKGSAKGSPSASPMHSMIEEDAEPEGTKSESDDMEKSAVSDLIDAIKADDVEAAHSALKDLIEMCSHERESMDPEEELEERE
jgi:hypothetical protein